jgi:hypothetical protein
MSKESKPTSLGQYLLFDVIVVILWSIFIGSVTYLTCFEINNGLPLWGVFPAILINSFITLCLMAFLFPKPKTGVHAMNSKDATFWFINFQFSRVWGYPPIKHFIFSIGVLRTIFLKCYGAKVSFSHAFSSYAHIHDPYFITIKKGTTVGMHAALIPHYINKGKLVLGDISIGENVIIGAWTRVTPGCSVGDNSFVSGDVNLAPGGIVPNNCRIGREAEITRRDNLNEGDVIPDFYNKAKEAKANKEA